MIEPATARAQRLAAVESSPSQHARDVERGPGQVEHPLAVARKYPGAAQSEPWQCLFPATRTYRYGETGDVRRHYLLETVVQRLARAALSRPGIRRKATVTPCVLSLATHHFEDGQDINKIRELLGHKDVSTTTTCTNVLNRNSSGVPSPLHRLDRP